MQPCAPGIVSPVCREDKIIYYSTSCFNSIFHPNYGPKCGTIPLKYRIVTREQAWYRTCKQIVQRLLCFSFTSMGKHGCSFSHVIKQSTPVQKAALPVLWGVKLMSWSIYWPHSTSRPEYRSSFHLEELLIIFSLTSRGCWHSRICYFGWQWVLPFKKSNFIFPQPSRQWLVIYQSMFLLSHH